VSATIRLGSQGWSYPDWVGSFYPPGAKQETQLPFYAEIFDTVELDNTFYRAPKPTIARSWARHTPAHFRFAAKAPREVTHEGALRVPGAMDELARSLEPLGEKQGPVLVQLPASYERTEQTHADLDRFLRDAPAALRLSVEFRHRSWHHESVYDLLRAHEAALTWTEWRTLPRVPEITAPFLYVRWIGNREDIERYDRTQIDRAREFDWWEAALRRSLDRVGEVYGYFNNHWAGHSPASAREMLRRLGLPARDPRELWPQGELW
jgi:uncharacterized protein YecE (DUF72 family)